MEIGDIISSRRTPLLSGKNLHIMYPETMDLIIFHPQS